MDAANVDTWRAEGVLMLPRYLSAIELTPALSELEACSQRPTDFHDATDPRHVRYRQDEFDGIDSFPFASIELSLLAVCPRLIELAEALLQEQDLRLYSAEAWAKYTGATEYDQDLHRDYLNYTLLVPTTAERYQQLEMFVFLCDVSEDLGPPHLVSQRHTAGLPANPNFLSTPRR
jgi:Phytanoyl-CoA dioxygenase (PhyH)